MEFHYFQAATPTLIVLCITYEPDSLIIFSQLSLAGNPWCNFGIEKTIVERNIAHGIL
jgi:hypothetical protein